MPFANIGAAIISALGEVSAISVSRRAAGAYVNGSWVQGAPTVIPMDAHVQPSSPKEVMQLPENERTSEAISIYTIEPLRTSDSSAQTESDVVTFAARQYKVMVVEDWSTQARYAKAIATRIGT